MGLQAVFCKLTLCLLRLIDRLVDLVGRLVGRLVDRLVDRLVGRLVDMLIDVKMIRRVFYLRCPIFRLRGRIRGIGN